MNVSLDLTQVLITVLTLALSWIFKELSSWLHARAAAVKQNSQHEKLDKYIDLAVQAVEDSVKAVNSTVVESLKAAAADGKLTKEEADQILRDSVNSVLGVLSGDAQEVLSTIYGDIPAWIQNKIENAVTAEKERKANLVSLDEILDAQDEVN